MTVAEYVQASLQYLVGLSPLLMVLSALGLADKILTFLFYVFKQVREAYK